LLDKAKLSIHEPENWKILPLEALILLTPVFQNLPQGSINPLNHACKAYRLEDEGVK
jgi:hypothetical protein